MAREAKATETRPLADSRGPVGGAADRADAREMEARGRMLTEYGELRRRLAELMAAASTVGAEFQELSDQLRMCPNVVAIEGLIEPNSNKQVFPQSLFDSSSIVDLVSEIRETIARKNEIQEQLQEIGVLDAYGQFRY